MRQDYPKFQQRGAEVVAITADALVRGHEYFRTYSLPFPLLLDPRRAVYRQYGVHWRVLSLGQRPGLFIVDKQGIVRYAHVGKQQWNIPRNADVLKVLNDLEA